MSFDRFGRRLFASLPSEMRIIAVDVDDVGREWYPVAGNGKSCTKVRRCGDGGFAVDAKLTYPKGVAVTFSLESPLLYFADGRDLRAIDLSSGVIWTASNVGRYGNRLPPPIGCDWEVPLSNYQFREKLLDLP